MQNPDSQILARTSTEQNAVVETQPGVRGGPDPREVLLDLRHRYAQPQIRRGIVVNRDVVETAVSCEQQALIGRNLAGIDRVQQREPAHPKCAEEVAAVSEKVAAGEGIEDLRRDLTGAHELLGRIRGLIDDPEAREALPVKEYD